MKQTINYQLENIFNDVKSIILYRLLRQKPVIEMPNTIKFEYDYDEKYKSLLISSPDYLGLQTIVKQGLDDEEIIEIVNDAILTYFEVPRYFAKKIKNNYTPLQSSGKYREFAIA